MSEDQIKVLPQKRSILSKINIPVGERKYFLITSPGQMGTFWLASQLNKHPQIFCSHSYDKPAWGAAGSPLRGEDGERQRAVIKECFATLSLKDFFKENAEVTNKPFVGNVHAFSIDRALALVKEESLSDIKIINLIRHPITRINSLVNCIRNEWFDFGYIDHLTFVPKIYLDHGRRLISECFGRKAASLKCDDSLEKQFFIASIILERGTVHQISTAEKNNILNIKYEDITTSRDCMEKVVAYLGEDSLIHNFDWINESISYKKINMHVGKSYDNIQSIFDGWESWKKELYKYVTNEEIFKIYTNGYYDFI